MRKHLIFAALAAIGTLIISSCEREKDIEIPTLNTKEVSLVLSGVATRSEADAPAQRYVYSLGEIEEGVPLALEEVVTEMGDLVDDVAETRGTPVYTQNVLDVHGDTFSGEIWGASGKVADDGPFKVFALSSKNCWRREIGFDPWEKAGGPVTFFLRMPAVQPGVSYLAYDYREGYIAFNYETPAKASDQQDILFATRNIDKETYIQEYKNGGANVLFRHALTGVKFAIGNNTTDAGNRRPNDEIQTFITKVEIVGLKDKGHAKFVPTGTETTTDDKDEHTSAGSFTWTDSSLNPTRTTVYSQTYGEDDIQDFAKGDDVNAPDSFYEGGANRNLNKKDASLTFWFIPQDITEDLVITVTVKVWHGGATAADGEMSTEKTLKLKLGELIKDNAKNKTWKAGQLRTFTLKPNLVNVDIHDKVTGFEKTDVEIKNTGNVDAYIRALIVANWYGTNVDSNEEGPAFGYVDDAGSAFLTPWALNNELTGDNYHGVFEELPGSGWHFATDGYFYYENAVAPGEVISPKLFKKYSLNTTTYPIPQIWYLSNAGLKEFQDVHMVMEIPVQAIEAKASYSDYKAAWNDATGKTIVPIN